MKNRSLLLIAILLGSLFALLEGEEKLRQPHDPGSPVTPLVVIAFAFVFEGLSLTKAVRAARRDKGDRAWFRFIRRTKDAELPVVLLEDSGALVGLVFAAAGIVLAHVTGDGRFDAVGSLAIGLLLGAIAITLATEMKSLLVGESATPEAIAALAGALRSPTASRGTTTVKPCEMASTAVARTQPEVEAPVTTSVSQRSLASSEASGVSWKHEAQYLTITASSGRGAMRSSISTHLSPGTRVRSAGILSRKTRAAWRPAASYATVV